MTIKEICHATSEDCNPKCESFGKKKCGMRRPKRNTECCRCGRKYSELKKLGIGLEEMKDVVGGDDWNWWCDDCLIKILGKECEICHDITTYAVRCPKCETILCSTCAKGHNCGIINRIRRFFSNKWNLIGTILLIAYILAILVLISLVILEKLW